MGPHVYHELPGEPPAAHDDRGSVSCQEGSNVNRPDIPVVRGTSERGILSVAHSRGASKYVRFANKSGGTGSVAAIGSLLDTKASRFMVLRRAGKPGEIGE